MEGAPRTTDREESAAPATASSSARLVPPVDLTAVGGPDRLRFDALAAGVPLSDLHALWRCPVCDVRVVQLRRPGRRRVYCTNACRQRAYRHRRRMRDRLTWSQWVEPRPVRARSRDRVHAIREHPDVCTDRRDSTGRGVTACGTFGRMAIDAPHRHGHVRFFGGRRPGVCQTCRVLTGVVEPPLDEIVAEVARHRARWPRRPESSPAPRPADGLSRRGDDGGVGRDSARASTSSA